MSTIEKKKPSQLNNFDGDLQGTEIMQVTKPNVGTYKATTEQLREYFSIIALTEQEFNNLENPIEGAFYGTFE